MGYDRGQPNTPGMMSRSGPGQLDSRREISEQSTQKVTALPLDSAERFAGSHGQSTPKSAPQRIDRATIVSLGLIGFLGLIETAFLLISLVPATTAAQIGWSATNGPFPIDLVPLISAIFYLVPFFVGTLTTRWDVALIGATFPAWAAVGLYEIVTAGREGAFSLTSNGNPNNIAGTLELFAILGMFGWLIRRVVMQGIARLRPSK